MKGIVSRRLLFFDGKIGETLDFPHKFYAVWIRMPLEVRCGASPERPVKFVKTNFSATFSNVENLSLVDEGLASRPIRQPQLLCQTSGAAVYIYACPHSFDICR